MRLLQVQIYLADLGRWIEHALIAVCGILLCVMASSVFFEVLIRYVIHAPTAWTEETAQFVLVWYGLLAAAVGARKGVHFAIRWGVIRFSEGTRWIIRQSVNVVVIIFLSTLLKLGLGYLDIVANQTSTGAEINMRIPWAGIPAGIGSILVIYILEVADAVLSIWTGRQFSVREAREEDIYRALRGETVPPAPVEASPWNPRTESGMAIAIGIAWLVFICLGVPIAFVLGASAMVGVLLSPDGFDLLPALVEQMFIAISSFNFLAIPLFIFAGGVLAESGVAKILMDLASITVGRGRGGLGASIVMSAMIFHGISGSSSADAAAIGKVTLPTLRTQGYPLPFSVALLATAGATGTLIPPTMDLIIIGIVGNMSIAGLFAAGILPAFVNGLGLMALVVFISRRRGYGNVRLPFVWKTAALAFLKAIPALFMIAIILGGILGGVFTPTEASSVAVFYGLFLAFVVYRSLTIRQFLGLFRATIEISGMVLLVIAMAAMLGYALTIFQVPTGLGRLLDSLAPERVLFLLFVQICFYLIGTCMDTVPAILILIPILTPLAIARGIEPIHFGILVECNVALHLACPPVGNVLFTACAVGNTPLELVIKPILPMIAILTVTMLIITYVPDIAMYLPRLLGLVD